ncbi:kinase-like protein [Rickenella mellea]|uniref:Kinase-like protein n=1 Tax=Rickenella mellea TaxID=50990 RepID=A0A4Y7PKH6_9AGAM|nr:kinase-like protein [Rickenella mellea]
MPENPFPCDTPGCNRSFQSHEAMLHHARDFHSKPSPDTNGVQAIQVKNTLKCGVPGCGFSFQSHDALVEHNEEVHGKSKAGATPVKYPHVCGVEGCERSYQTSEALKHHHRDSHESPQSGNSSTSNLPDLHQHTIASHPKRKAVNTGFAGVAAGGLDGVRLPVPQERDYQEPGTSPAAPHFQRDPQTNPESHTIPPTSPDASPVFQRLESSAGLTLKSDNGSKEGGNAQLSAQPALQSRVDPTTLSDTSGDRQGTQEITLRFTPEEIKQISLLVAKELNISENHVFPIKTSKLKVYETLVHTLGQNLSEPSELRQKSGLRDRLQDHVNVMWGLDDVSSLTKCSQFRKQLMELLNEAKYNDNPEVRRALQNDQNDVFHLLHGVVNSRAAEGRVLELKGDEAVCFMNLLVSSTKEGPFADDPVFFHKARSLQRKLHKKSGSFPSELHIEGVEVQHDRHPVGRGGFAEIFKGKLEGKWVALKRLKSHEGDLKAREALFREASTWVHLRHPFILPFLGLDFESYPNYLPCIVTPWMANGTILEHIERYSLPTESIEILLLEITRGLAYLHSKDVVHGDIRGNNILIDDSWRACLADFGLAGFTDETVQSGSSINHAGSLKWMAPELHNPEAGGLDRFSRTKASDIYALGCTILEVYTGRAPFSDVSGAAVPNLVAHQSLRPERPCEISPDRWSLIEDCWRQNHADRKTVEQVLELMEDMNFGASEDSKADDDSD